MCFLSLRSFAFHVMVDVRTIKNVASLTENRYKIYFISFQHNLIAF